MKSNEVIIVNEWFGRNKKDKAPQIGNQGQTYVTSLAHKLFMEEFVSDIMSTIQNGISSGLIAPPTGLKGPEDDQVPPEGPDGRPDGKDGKDGKDGPQGPQGPGGVQPKRPTPPEKPEAPVKPGDESLRPGFQEKIRRFFNPNMEGDLKYGKWVVDMANSGRQTDWAGKPERNTNNPKRNKKWQLYTLNQLASGEGTRHGKLSSQEIKRAYPGWNGKLGSEMVLKEYKYTQLNSILESLINEEDGDAIANAGRPIGEFLRQWEGQWMQGVTITDSKPLLDAIIAQIETEYNNSKNPQKPNINMALIQKLGNASWAASKSVGIPGAKRRVPVGAQNADKADEIEAGITQGDDEEVAQPAKQTVPIGYKLQMAGLYWVWDGKKWTTQQGTEVQTANLSQTEALTLHALTNPEASADKSIYKKGGSATKSKDYDLGDLVSGASDAIVDKIQNDPSEEEVARQQATATRKGKQFTESKTNSALRAEKIALLKTR